MLGVNGVKLVESVIDGMLKNGITVSELLNAIANTLNCNEDYLPQYDDRSAEVITHLRGAIRTVDEIEEE